MFCVSSSYNVLIYYIKFLGDNPNDFKVEVKDEDDEDDFEEEEESEESDDDYTSQDISDESSMICDQDNTFGHLEALGGKLKYYSNENDRLKQENEELKGMLLFYTNQILTLIKFQQVHLMAKRISF